MHIYFPPLSSHTETGIYTLTLNTGVLHELLFHDTFFIGHSLVQGDVYVLRLSNFMILVKHRMEQKLEQMGRGQGVKLHTAHMLCMDAILNVGLEMGSHNHDCWPHVFRYMSSHYSGLICYFQYISWFQTCCTQHVR